MTTTPNELRAAAEKMASGDITCLHHKGKLDYNLTTQAITIAEHYLSSIPPDADEPISEEWLREIGWTRVQLRLEMVVDGRTIELYDCVIADSPMRGLLWNAYWRVPCNPDRQQWPIPLTNRRQLRALIAALGVDANKKVGVCFF